MMKTALKTLALLLCGYTAHADCNPGFNFHPRQHSVHKNTKIIIESYFWFKYRDLLKELDHKYPIYLKSQNNKVRLIQEVLIDGTYGMSQAIFRLEEPLVPGEVYYIEIENLSSVDSLAFDRVRRQNSMGENERIFWIATDTYDDQSPEIQKQPQFCETRLYPYGCGPEVLTKFEFSATDKSDIYILAELQEIESNTISQFYVPTKDNIVAIGHGMCAGSLDLERGKHYNVRFKFYDINGNTDDTWTQWMACPNPWEAG
jgi:hypothetical protein